MMDQSSSDNRRFVAPSTRPLADEVVDDTIVWAMVDAAPDGTLLCGDDGTILFANTQVEVLFGYDRAELLGASVDVLLPDEVRHSHHVHRGHYMNAPAVRTMGKDRRLKARRHDGSEFDVEVALSPMVSADRVFVIATVRDITDRLAIESFARDIQQLLDGTRDGVYVIGANHTFDYVNEGAVLQSGYNRGELLQMGPLDVLVDLGRDDFDSMVAPLTSGISQDVRVEHQLRRRDGSFVDVEADISYPTQTDGERRLVAVVRDVSDRHAAEAAKLAASTIEALADERERTARDLHDTVVQQLFATGLSLQSCAARVTDDGLINRLSDAVDDIDAAIRQLRASIFAGSRPRNIASDANPRQALHAIVAESGRLMRQPPVFTINGDINDDVWLGAYPDLAATLRECLSNVARHAQASAVTVTIDCTGQQLRLSVNDDGIGIRESAIRSGNGITNLTARARKHGGHFVVEPRAPQGTSACWTIPAPKAS
jgi:PAS domain S-box-containing protein